MDGSAQATMELTADDLARLLAIQISAVSGKGEFEGYAALWDMPDRYETICAKGAFDEVLAGYVETGLYPPLAWEHGDIVGALKLVADEKGLRVQGQIDLADELGKRAFERVKASQFYLSFWAGADRAKNMTDAEGRTVYTRFLHIRDISITSDPGQQLATIDVVRNRHKAEIEAARQAGYAEGEAAGRAAALAEREHAEALAGVKAIAQSLK